jgi:hypothetical protein
MGAIGLRGAGAGGAAPPVPSVTCAGAHLRVLATSRASLWIDGEVTYRPIGREERDPFRVLREGVRLGRGGGAEASRRSVRLR